MKIPQEMYERCPEFTDLFEFLNQKIAYVIVFENGDVTIEPFSYIGFKKTTKIFDIYGTITRKGWQLELRPAYPEAEDRQEDFKESIYCTSMEDAKEKLQRYFNEICTLNNSNWVLKMLRKFDLKVAPSIQELQKTGQIGKLELELLEKEGKLDILKLEIELLQTEIKRRSN